jgi:hypothetical protein
LGINGSQIKRKGIFSLDGISTNLRRCHLQTNFLKKLIFVNKIWVKYPRIGCKSPNNLLEILERDEVVEV